MGAPPRIIKSLRKPPTDGDTPGNVWATWTTSLFPPGYVAISTADKDWVDRGVSLGLLMVFLLETTTSSKDSDDSIKIKLNERFPFDLIITLNFVYESKPTKLAVKL